jgi:L-ribulose-5-phosphate 4-epimerase
VPLLEGDDGMTTLESQAAAQHGAPTEWRASDVAGRTLTAKQELALLARILDREGFNTGYVDALSGHITMRLADDRIIVNPWGIPWGELRASDVVTADINGRLVEGNLRVTPGATIHFMLHQQRRVAVSVHNHPRWATIWADHHRIPPVYDQTSAKLTGKIVVVHEYEGVVKYQDIASRVVTAMENAETALLAHHGALVVGSSPCTAMLRCLALEARSRNAWHVEALGGRATELDEQIREAQASELAKEEVAQSTYLALIRRELHHDPTVLD